MLRLFIALLFQGLSFFLISFSGTRHLMAECTAEIKSSFKQKAWPWIVPLYTETNQTSTPEQLVCEGPPSQNIPPGGNMFWRWARGFPSAAMRSRIFNCRLEKGDFPQRYTNAASCYINLKYGASYWLIYSYHVTFDVLTTITTTTTLFWDIAVYSSGGL